MSRKKTILLIEDNPDLRDAIGDALRSLDHKVLVAASEASALEMARDGLVDLMVVNAYPAHGRGLETVDRVRRHLPGTPAVLVSGFGDDDNLRRRVASGDVAFLAIPFSIDGLAAAIDRCLDARRGPVPLEEAPDKTVAPVVDPETTQPPRRWRLQPVLAAAAGLTLALGLVFRFGTGTPELPAPDPQSAHRGSTIQLLEPIGEIAAAPARLTWTGVPDASRYKVVLETVDQTVLWETETGDTSVEVPVWLSDRLHPSVTYYWHVVGFGDGLSPLGTSSSVAFFARPEPQDHPSPMGLTQGA